MKRETKLITWLVAGIVFSLGPIWGMIGTVIGMLLAFGNLGQQEPQAEALASNISIALYTTAAGWIACPIGIVIIIVSAIKIGKMQKETGIPNNTPEDIGAGRAESSA